MKVKKNILKRGHSSGAQIPELGVHCSSYSKVATAYNVEDGKVRLLSVTFTCTFGRACICTVITEIKSKNSLDVKTNVSYNRPPCQIKSGLISLV